jgi:cytochrome c peroxidase
MKLSVRPLCLAALMVAAAGCDDTTVVDGGPATLDEQLRRSIDQYGPVPIGALPSQRPELVALGRALMFDKVLSGNRDIACGTCHEPSLHATDGLPLPVGTGGTGVGAGRTLGSGRSFVPRNAPSLLNSAIGLPYVFWDGRLTRFEPPPPELPPTSDLTNLLVAQAMMPVLNRREMRGEVGDVDVFGNPNELAQFADTEATRIWNAVMQRVLAIPEYMRMFGQAYPGRTSFTMRDAAVAMVAFQMDQLMRTNSPFDRYLARDDNAISVEAKRGGVLFFGDAKCSQCHNGPFLGGTQFANSGVPQIGPGVGKDAPLDLGRGGVFPQSEFYKFAFRVPPLRNVELTAPYMHNGAFATLESVVAHYNDVTKSLREFDPTTLPAAVRGSYHGDGATINAILATLDFRLNAPLELTPAQQHELVEFLKSLTDPAARDLSGIAPATVPSGLPIH